MAPAWPIAPRHGSKLGRWLILGVLLNGCSTPTAPSVRTMAGPDAADASAMTVVIQTFYYSNQTLPFPGVAVRVNGAFVGTTQTDGTLTVDVPKGVETTIQVTSSGYRPASASAAVNGPGEHWSFWLMRDAVE